MNGVSAPVVWVVVLFLAGAWLWHTLADHHGHLVLLRVIRPSTVVPETRHDSRWHAASHPRRLMANLLLTGAAILTGLAWELSPYAAAAMVIGSGIVLAILSYMRRAGRGSLRPGSAQETEGRNSLWQESSAGSSSA